MFKGTIIEHVSDGMKTMNAAHVQYKQAVVVEREDQNNSSFSC